MSTTKPDDLEAVRTIAATLEPFDELVRERILKWAREKIGLPTGEAPLPPSVLAAPSPPSAAGSAIQAAGTAGSKSLKSIKDFVTEKNPSSNNEFAATVAYYHRFEAPTQTQKPAINANDLQEACRLSGRPRLPTPGQTLINAHSVGLLDKSERGFYSISTVGENLVAMTLPTSAGNGVRATKRKKSTPKKSKKRLQA